MSLGIDIDLTVDYLEDTLEGDCKCESRHTDPMNPLCSIEVTAVCTGCKGGPVLICDNSVRYIRWVIGTAGFCEECGRHARDCWRVIPV